MRWLHLLLSATLAALISLPPLALSSADAPPWWNADWRFREKVVLHETASIERVREPALIRLVLPAERMNDPLRELRVLAWSGEWVEVPLQILSCRKEEGMVVVELALLANSSPRGTATYYVYYGNPHASPPAYSTDLSVGVEDGSVTVGNSFYELTLSEKKGGGVSRLFVRSLGIDLASKLSGEASFQFEYRASGREYRQALGKLKRLEVVSRGPVLASVIVEVQVWDFNVTQEWTFFAYNPFIRLKLRVDGGARNLEWVRYINTRFDALSAQRIGFDSWYIDGGFYRVSSLPREDAGGFAWIAALTSTEGGIAIGAFRLDGLLRLSAGWERELKWETDYPLERVVEDFFLYIGPTHKMLRFRESLKNPLTPEMWLRTTPALEQPSQSDMLERASFVIFLIPHSHWDPDWLMPWSEASERVRSIIASAVKLTIAQPGFKYVVDQVCFIRYFWEKASELERELFRESVRRGAIEVAGGMVSQPDTNLVSEPGLVWDAYLGHRWTIENLGAEPSPVAWQCDPFGHSPTLPEFLLASGYRYVYFGRCGEGQEAWLPHAFWWVGPTGARVLAYFRDYCAGEFLLKATSADAVAGRLVEIAEEAQKRDGIGATVLPVGCDFTHPPAHLLELVNDWNQRYLNRTGIGLVIATPSEAFKFIEKKYGGRLREIKLDPNPLWQGWYITRPAAKLTERRASTLLSTITKLLPLVALAGFNVSELAEQVAAVWFNLSVNHHHDSITGTSPDSSWNASIWPRYASSLAAAEQLYGRFVTRLAEVVGDRSSSSVVVFNPSLRTRSGIVIVNAILRTGLSRLMALDGEASRPVQVLSVKPSNATHSVYELAVDSGPVPPLGYKALELMEGELEVRTPVTVRIEGGKAILENAYVRLVVNVKRGGLIEELVDKITGNRLLAAPSGEIVFYRDWGDVYGFSLGSTVAAGRAFDVDSAEVIWSGPLAAKLRLQLKGATKATLEYTVYCDMRGVDLSVTVTALRDTTGVLVLSGAGGRVMRGTPFGAAEGGDARFWPYAYWFALEPLRGPSLLVINRGAAQGVRFLASGVEIGLVRDCSTPKADKITFADQAPHTIELRLLAYDGKWSENTVWLEAYDFNYPLVAVAAPPVASVLPRQLGLLSADWAAELVDILPLGNELILVLSNPLLAPNITLYTALEISEAYTSLIDGRKLAPANLAEGYAVALAARRSITPVIISWRPRMGAPARLGAELNLSIVNASGRAVEVELALRGEKGEALAGRIVEIKAKRGGLDVRATRAVTDFEGRARARLELNASGRAELYATFDGDLIYASAESSSVAIELLPLYRFSLLVLDPLGDPLSGARVTILSGGRTLFLSTDEQGFAEALLTPGNYTIRVRYADAAVELKAQVAASGGLAVKLGSVMLLLTLPKVQLTLIAALLAVLLAIALLKLARPRGR